MKPKMQLLQKSSLIFTFTAATLLAASLAAFTRSAYALSDEPAASPIAGEWQFYKMIIDGQEFPPRDPRLKLIYTFDTTADGIGVDRLYWTYDDGATFCERMGQFIYKDGFLMDDITWVNPKNKDECSTDLDMQMGRKATSQLDIVKAGANSELSLHVPFGDKEILYVWRHPESASTSAKK
jgi:hypothetical protein